jgi:hypothetical protein
MEANQTGHESRGQQPQQPRQPPQCDAAMSTRDEVTATIVADGLRHCDHIIVHRPPPAQPAHSSHLHQRAPKKKYRAVIKDSYEEQQKDADHSRESLWNGTHARNVYVAIRENNPTTGLPKQAHAARSPPYPGQPQSKEVPKADDRNRQQQAGMQLGNNDHNLLLKKWRELAEKKEVQEAETTSVLEAFKASLFEQDRVPHPEDTLFGDTRAQAMDRPQSPETNQACRPGIALPGIGETCPLNPRSRETKSINPRVGRGNLRGWDDRRARSVPRITNISSQNSANKDGDWIRIKWRSH